MANPLIQEVVNENGQTVYKMATFDIDVIAKMNGGLAPTLIYLHDQKDVTDWVRALRFGTKLPSSYIEDYDPFQAMLFQKEEKAINDLYDTISIRPKNMSTGKQILWSFAVLSLMAIPLLIAMFIMR
ncbi:sodium:proton antiporter [Ureibacillus sp. MALMAid1270]|uniref:sodium:proton antiporter n=1 Tax=Ureibacillus sp. MALMAid1270 TaxID=3411629 RepID=UPI003BA70AE4